MNTILNRILWFLAVLGGGLLLFYLLLQAGEKGKGPLEHAFTRLNSRIAQVEHRVLNQTEKRADSLKWLTDERDNLEWLRNPDTFLLGAFDNRSVSSFQPIFNLEQSLGKNFSLLHLYSAWGSKAEQLFPQLQMQAIYDMGSIPLLTWEPWLDDMNSEDFPWVAGKENPNQDGLQAIANGHFDEYIDRWAKDALAFGRPFFLRFGHEMNDPYRYPWGPQNNGAGSYIRAWQHVVQRFRDLGVNNVLWVWSPHPSYRDFAQFYPGDGYVDWIGLTALNYGTVASWSNWWSFEEIVQVAYDSLQVHPKPMMIAELGCLAVGGDREQWFARIDASLSEKYPRIKSALFFNHQNDLSTTYKSLDWNFANDTATIMAIRAWQFDSY